MTLPTTAPTDVDLTTVQNPRVAILAPYNGPMSEDLARMLARRLILLAVHRTITVVAQSNNCAWPSCACRDPQYPLAVSHDFMWRIAAGGLLADVKGPDASLDPVAPSLRLRSAVHQMAAGTPRPRKMIVGVGTTTDWTLEVPEHGQAAIFTGPSGLYRVAVEFGPVTVRIARATA